MGERTRTLHFVVQELEGKVRLDAYVGSVAKEISRSTLSTQGTTILLNDKLVKKSKLVGNGDRITVTYREDFFEGLVAQPLPLAVLYEDDDMLIINKEQGMVVHPANGNPDGTLVNALLYRYGNEFANALSDQEQDQEEELELSSPAVRPGIVHRLDKETSGVLVVARNRISHRHLSAQFKNRTTKKVYIALAYGNFKQQQGSIKDNITRDPNDRKRFTTAKNGEGKTAHTDYVVLRQYSGFALVRIVLHTGRTHQIRVHLKSIGHPLVGDDLYGKDDEQRLMLHALYLELESPTTHLRIKARAPLPPRFKQYIRTAHPRANVPVPFQFSPTARDRG